MYLGRVLRELREAAQMSTSEVCARIEFSPARLSRPETGPTAADIVVVKELLGARRARGLLLFARAHGIACVEGDTAHNNTASQHVMTTVGMRLVAEDDRLKHYKITWTDAAAITDPRSQ